MKITPQNTSTLDIPIAICYNSSGHEICGMAAPERGGCNMDVIFGLFTLLIISQQSVVTIIEIAPVVLSILIAKLRIIR